VHIEVETRNVGGQVTALGSAGPFTLVVDRPVEGGGSGLGFNGGQLLYLAVAGCISNDLFRDARAAGIELSHMRVKVRIGRLTSSSVSKPCSSSRIGRPRLARCIAS
jgi:putative redox protein